MLESVSSVIQMNDVISQVSSEIKVLPDLKTNTFRHDSVILYRVWYDIFKDSGACSKKLRLFKTDFIFR